MADLSVVIPVFNEAPNLEALHREFTGVLRSLGRPYEFILVDDGSTDESFEILKRIQVADAAVRVIRFRRNFGQTAAFAAGIDAARGGLIITADADLQNDPRDIPAMLQDVAGGADIVCGWRKDRKDPFLSRRLPSMVANKLISWATGVALNDYGCSLKVFRAEVVKPLRLRGEMHRFLPALASEFGVRIVERPVNHRPRAHGTSKYGISRTFRVMLDLIAVKFLLNYSTQPLRIFGMVGGIMSFGGVVLLGYLGTLRLLQVESIMRRLPLTLFGILLLFTGVQLVTLGLLAELQARTYHESQGRPIYVVREVLESAPGPADSAGRRESGA
jgi:glycosyltransferase involved in cell wall biosynthesis